MPVRRACSVLLACTCAVAGLAGCSSGPGPVCACPAAAKPAYALDVTTAGRVRWQVPLPSPALGSANLSPLAVGAVAVFAASNFPFAFSVPGGDTASAMYDELLDLVYRHAR